MRPRARARRLGQHMLASAAVLAKIIAEAAIKPTDTILEIGPGTGALTRAMAERAGTIVAVEKDQVLCRELKADIARLGLANVRLVCSDILDTPFAALDLGSDYRIIANIPYYLTSRLMRNLLEAETPPRDMFIMVQREVAERIVARPPRMNLLALSVQAYAEAAMLFVVPRLAFAPPPGVDSAFVRIKPRDQTIFERAHIPPEQLFAVARAAFGGRRKILENTLAAYCRAPKPTIIRLLGRLGLTGKRPQELSVEDWMRVTRSVGKSVLP